jgi:crotonobetainyl-CoA:carnitine CoA-transferase CaiB-like acyl-CoA transferase
MKIDISLWDCAVAALVNQAHNAMASGSNPQPMGSAHPNLVPYRAFKANDGWFVIGVGSDNQWSALAAFLSIDAPDEWSTNEGRVLNRASVEKAVGDAVSSMSRHELESLLVGIPCAPVNTVLEALNDPQSVSRGAVTQHQGVDVLASPLRFMHPSE